MNVSFIRAGKSAKRKLLGVTWRAWQSLRPEATLTEVGKIQMEALSAIDTCAQQAMNILGGQPAEFGTELREAIASLVNLAPDAGLQDVAAAARRIHEETLKLEQART